MGRTAIAKTDFGQRLTAVRTKLGYTARNAFAGVLKINSETLGGYERGESSPPLEFLAGYKQRFGVNLDWLITGSGDMFGTDPFQVHGPDGQPTAYTARHVKPDAPEVDFLERMIFLPQFDVQASAGVGVIPVSEETGGAVAFERRFLRDLGGNPESCFLLWAKGDSMLPTIPDGALMVVDQSQTIVEHGCIYVFNVSGALLVKRARWRLDGRLELVSDNKGGDYPVETFGADRVEDLVVVGRVIYFGRAP